MGEAATLTAENNETLHLASCEAALAMARERRDEAVGVLRSLTKEGSPAVRCRVAECLTELGGEQAAVGLSNLLGDPNHRVRIAAADGLGFLNAHAIRKQLVNLMENDPHIEVRIAAARALGRLQDYGGLPMIVDMLYKGNERIQRLAVRALKDIIGQSFTPDYSGIQAAKRYLQVQGKKYFSGDDL